MKKVKRTYKGETKNHPVYTQEEADNKGIEYVYWKEATEAGQWALSDDKWVAEVLGINGPYQHQSGRESKQIVLPYCRMFDGASSTIVFEDFYGKGDYSTSSPTTWDVKEGQKNRTKRVIRLYASLLLEKGRVPEKDMKKLGFLWRPDEKIPSASFKKLLRKKSIKKMVQEELTKMLTDQQITPEEVVKRYNELYSDAKTRGQLGVAKGVLDTFKEMLNLVPDKRNLQGALPEGGESDDELIGILESERTEVVNEDHDAEFLDEDMEVKPEKAENGQQ